MNTGESKDAARLRLEWRLANDRRGHMWAMLAYFGESLSCFCLLNHWMVSTPGTIVTQPSSTLGQCFAAEV